MKTRSKSKPHPHAALPDAGSGSLISDARLVELYTAMLRCRMLRDRIRALRRPAKLRRFASVSEAVAAAATIGLLPEDAVISSAPDLCAAMLKGVPLESILRAVCARPSNKHSSNGADSSLIASGVLHASLAGARHLDVAAGAAFAGKRSNRAPVAVSFFEDAAAKDSSHSTFDFALAHELPLIFVRQAARPFQTASRRGKSSRRSAFPPGSLPIIPVDSNDAVAVYRVAHEAIAHARRGSGPTLIDCVPLRLAGERKQDSDCIARMERYLEAKGLRPERIKAGLAARFARVMDNAVAAARSNPRASRQVRRSAKAGK